MHHHERFDGGGYPDGVKDDEIPLESRIIVVADSILTKSNSLSDEEWREMKKHPAIDYRIAMAAPELKHIAEYMLCHHERCDRKGYPQGLSGEEILILSRILTVVDSYAICYR